MAFDPDAFLATPAKAEPASFDPDAFLAKPSAPVASLSPEVASTPEESRAVAAGATPAWYTPSGIKSGAIEEARAIKERGLVKGAGDVASGAIPANRLIGAALVSPIEYLGEKAGQAYQALRGEPAPSPSLGGIFNRNVESAQAEEAGAVQSLKGIGAGIGAPAALGAKSAFGAGQLMSEAGGLVPGAVTKLAPRLTSALGTIAKGSAAGAGGGFAIGTTTAKDDTALGILKAGGRGAKGGAELGAVISTLGVASEGAKTRVDQRYLNEIKKGAKPYVKEALQESKDDALRLAREAGVKKGGDPTANIAAVNAQLAKRGEPVDYMFERLDRVDPAQGARIRDVETAVNKMLTEKGPSGTRYSTVASKGLAKAMRDRMDDMVTKYGKDGKVPYGELRAEWQDMRGPFQGIADEATRDAMKQDFSRALGDTLKANVQKAGGKVTIQQLAPEILPTINNLPKTMNEMRVLSRLKEAFEGQESAAAKSTADPLSLARPLYSSKRLARGALATTDEVLAKMNRAITGAGDASKALKAILEHGENRQLLEMSLQGGGGGESRPSPAPVPARGY